MPHYAVLCWTTAGATVHVGSFIWLSPVLISTVQRDREQWRWNELSVDSDGLHLVSVCFAQFRSEPVCPRDAEALSALQCVLSYPPLTFLWGWGECTLIFLQAQSRGVCPWYHPQGREGPPNFWGAVLWSFSLAVLTCGDERCFDEIQVVPVIRCSLISSSRLEILSQRRYSSCQDMIWYGTCFH